LDNAVIGVFMDREFVEGLHGWEEVERALWKRRSKHSRAENKMAKT